MKKIYFVFILFALTALQVNGQQQKSTFSTTSIENIDLITEDPALMFYTPISYDLGNQDAGTIANIEISVAIGSGCWTVESDRSYITVSSIDHTESKTMFCEKDFPSTTIHVKIVYPNASGPFRGIVKITSVDDPDNIYYEIAIEGFVTDYEPPTAPTNLQLISAGSYSLYFKWDESYDNVSVLGYKIFKDGVYVGSTHNLYYNLTNLDSNTEYTISVRAYDTSNNNSAATTENFITAPAPMTAMIMGPNIGNNYNFYTWTALVSLGDVGVEPITYLWEYGYDGNSYPGTFYSTSSTLTAQMPINYDLYLKLTVTDANGLQVIAYHTTYNESDFFKSSKNITNENNLSDNIEFNISPNPGNGIYTIKKPNAEFPSEIYVYNMNGKLITKKLIESSQITIDISGQPKGVYLFKIKSNSFVQTKKVIKK